MTTVEYRRPSLTAIQVSSADVAALLTQAQANASDADLSVWRALASAAADVIAAERGARHFSASVDDVQATASALIEQIRRAAAGDSPDVTAISSLTPARRVLEQMRTAFLLHAAAPVVATLPARIVEVLRGMERVQAALHADASHRFTARLTGTDAMQLIVEMAHDMRSPLGSILVLAERLRMNAADPVHRDLHRRQLGLIYSAAFGLSALAGDVIELARGGTTLLDKETSPFSVRQVLLSIEDILRPMAEEKRLTLNVAPPEADHRLGHGSALNRVLLNLATNAIKFTNAGSVTLHCMELDRRRVEFSVTDTGRGIPESVQAHLFEAFRQRQQPGDYAFSSAGLGLSICQKLILAMGGELRVDSALERGTRFHFTLDLPQASRF